MNNSDSHNQRIAKMTFSSVYPLYLAKVEKKGRSKEELNQVHRVANGLRNQQTAGTNNLKSNF
jgi:hypothetical protein